MYPTILLFAVATQWTPDDIVSQYHQNALQAQTLRVQWMQTSAVDGNTARRYRAFSKSLAEKNASDPKLTREQRDAAKTTIAAIQRQETLLLPPKPINFQGDFWSDRVHFQLRSPSNPELGGPWFHGPKPSWVRMPEADISSETLTTDFAETWITSWGPATKSLFRRWDGRRNQGVWLGVVGMTGPQSVIFPPLANPPAEWGGTSSLIDEFFGPDPARTRVLGEALIDGVSTIVLERVWFQGKITRALIGYIDVTRGSIPLRIEVYPLGRDVSAEHKWPIPRVSKHLDGEQLAMAVLSGVTISNHEGIYYPMRGVVEHLLAIGNFIGDEIAVRLTETWDVHAVEWNRPMPEEMFALEFPQNTVFIDETKNETRLTGNVDGYAERIIGGLRPERKSPSQAWLWWTLSIVAVALVLGISKWRRGAR